MKEALKLALESLEAIANETYDSWTNGAKAQRIAQGLIPSIKKALVQDNRLWVSLTDDEFLAIVTWRGPINNLHFDRLEYAKAIEAKLKEKNT